MFSSHPTVIRPQPCFPPSLSIPSHLFTGWEEPVKCQGNARWTSSPTENAGEKDIVKMPSPPRPAASLEKSGHFPFTAFGASSENSCRMPCLTSKPTPRPRESTSAVLNPESNQKKCILVSWFPVEANCCLPSMQAMEVENTSVEFPDVYICLLVRSCG